MKKKIIVIISAVLVVLLLGGGIVYAVQQTTGKSVLVVPVTDIETGYWGSDVNISGIITSNASQEVHLNDQQIVDKVFVKEGDEVQVGTPLLSFDTTLTALNLESEKLDKSTLEIKRTALEKEIAKLQKTKPVQKTASTDIDMSKALQPMTYTTVSLVPIATDTSDPTETPEATETPEESPSPTPTPHEPTPEDILSMDTYISAWYEGDGSENNPFKFLGKWDNEHYYIGLQGAFLNMVKENNYAMWIYLYDNNDRNELLRGAIFISGGDLGTYEDDVIYVANLTPDGGTDIDEGNGTGDVDDYFGDNGNYGDFTDGDIPTQDQIVEGYTKEELAKLIQEKQQELRSLALDIRQSDLTIAQTEKSLQNQEVKSTVNGIVKSVGDPAKGELNGKAFLVVESTEGLYVQGSLSELLLGDITVGQVLQGTSYESGLSFTAEIREISPYPTNSGDSWGGNMNVSYYPFTAYIEDGQGLKNNESVGFVTTIDGEASDDALYIQLPFVREENGISYVYIANDKDRLERREVVTGKTVEGYSIEIKSGLTRDDRIAFPYGSDVKNGAKIKDGTISDMYA